VLYYACPTCSRLVRVIKEQGVEVADVNPSTVSLVRCKRCGHYVDFGDEFWVNGEPYCKSCAVAVIEENERRVRGGRKD